MIQEPTERTPNGQSGIMLYSTIYPRHKILYEKMRQNKTIVGKYDIAGASNTYNEILYSYKRTLGKNEGNLNKILIYI